MIASAVSAMPLFNVPTSLMQPNGDTLHCFVSGDEYYQRLHDADGYTIVKNPQTGWWVYADTVHTSADRWQVVPTGYVAGIVDPHTVVALHPNIGIDNDTWLERQKAYDIPTADAPKTSGRNHGRMNNLVIFVRFSDQDGFTTPLSTVDSMLNDSSATSTSMYSYFKQVSYNKLEIVSHYFPLPSGNTIVSYQDIHPRSYYMPDYLSSDGFSNSAEGHQREKGLMQRAVNAVGSQIPASLNIDMNDDGYVDNVCFVVKGVYVLGGEVLWPHRSILTDSVAYINGKQVYNYNILLEGGGNYFTSSEFCHEMFHSLGAPDLYRYNNGTYSFPVYPVGAWDLMCYNRNPPQHMGAYMKWKYGNWLDSIPTITQPGTYTLHSLGDSAYGNCCYRIATSDPHQWYVLEYRDSTERFETSLPGTGLLIYRIDDRYTGSGNYNGTNRFDEVYLFRPNAFDGSTNGQMNANVPDAYFSGSIERNAFTPQTNPHPWLTGGIPDSAFAIVDIGVPDSTICFTYTPICLTPNGLSTSNITDTSARLSWQTNADSVLLQWHPIGAPYINSAVVGGHSLLLDTLHPSTEYEWRVKAICAIGDSSWFSPWDTFSTTQCLLQESTVGVAETTSYALPFNTWYNYSWTQMIYTSSEVGEAKEITALSFNYFSNNLTNKNNCVIYLGTTTDSAINMSYGNPQFLPASQLHIVYEGPISCVYGWNTIELDRSFYYNGTDNLVVAIDDNSGISFSQRRFYCSLTPGRNSSITCFHDDINIDPDGTEFPYPLFREAFQFRADIRFIGCALPEMPVFQVNASSSDSTLGSVSGGGIYEANSLATITATPAPHHHFAYWLSDGDTITANPYTFCVAANRTFVAWFVIDSFTVSLNATDNGIVSGNGVYNYGDTVTITATPTPHYHFTYWLSYSDTITDNPYSFVVSSDTTFTALFAIDTHYISIASNDTTIGYAWLWGPNYEQLASARLPYGTWVNIHSEVRPNVEGYGYVFLQWSDGNTDPWRMFPLTQDTSLVAFFEAQALGIQDAANPFSVVQLEGGIEVIGAVGAMVELYDVIGRCHWRAVAAGRQRIFVSRPGVYLLRINEQVHKVVVRR